MMGNARPSAVKVIAFNLLGIGLMAVGLFLGVVEPIFVNDLSYLTYVIAATMVSIIFVSLYDSFVWTDWGRGYMKFQEGNLTKLGLAGTLIGLIFLIGVISAVVAQMGGHTDDMIPRTLEAFAGAMRTAFNPTLVGVAGWYWTGWLLYFKRVD